MKTILVTEGENQIVFMLFLVLFMSAMGKSVWFSLSHKSGGRGWEKERQMSSFPLPIRPYTAALCVALLILNENIPN